MALSLTDIELSLLRDALKEYEHMTDSFSRANLGRYSNQKGWEHTSMMVKTLRLRIEHLRFKAQQQKRLECSQKNTLSDDLQIPKKNSDSLDNQE